MLEPTINSVELSLARRNTLGSALWRSAQIWRNRPAVTDVQNGITLTFGELNEQANRTARALSRRGVGKGTPVALVMRNRVEYVCIYFALAKLSAIAVPLNFRLLPAELSLLIGQAQCTHLIVDSHAANVIEVDRCSGLVDCLGVGAAAAGMLTLDELIAGETSDEISFSDARETDVFAYMYTAGTTGAAKASIKTHAEYVFAATSFILRFAVFMDVSPGTTYLAVTPIFHGGAFTNICMALFHGWHVVLLPTFTVEYVVEAINRYKVNIGWLVPTMLGACLRSGMVGPETLKTMKVIFSGGAVLPPSQRSELESTWPNVVLLNIYGQTEACGPIACANSLDTVRNKPSSLGQPFYGLEISVRAQTDKPLAVGELGEICYRGPQMSQGYHRNQEATVKAFRNGWFHSGDVGYLDEDGDLFLVDRLDDMMITGAENVYPSEVEDVLLAHPGVLEACVFGMPDPVWGERVSAAVVATGPAVVSATDLIAHCRARLAHFKCPAKVYFWPALPKSAVGKILRRVARDQAASNDTK